MPFCFYKKQLNYKLNLKKNKAMAKKLFTAGIEKSLQKQ
jgi:hypothetical protein